MPRPMSRRERRQIDDMYDRLLTKCNRAMQQHLINSFTYSRTTPRESESHLHDVYRELITNVICYKDKPHHKPEVNKLIIKMLEASLVVIEAHTI